MPYRLRDNLYWCVSGGRTVFLDVEADRYFCLPRAAEAAFGRLANGQLEENDVERLHPLVARGLLIPDPDPRRLLPKAPIERAEGDLLQQPQSSPRARDVAGALARELTMAWHLRRRRLLDVLPDVRRSGRPLPKEGSVDECLHRIVSASMAVSLVLRATDRCLVRALAVHSSCRRQGIDASLVLGVRMNPFGAHCWVQHKKGVLVGDFEQVRLFDPILALG